MNKDKLKKITIFSLITGTALGVISLLPFIQFISVLVMSIFSSIIVIFYMQKKKFINALTIKGAGIIGAYIGFVSLAGFLLTFLPLAAIFGALVHYIAPNNIYFSGIKFLIQIWWILLLMGGLITALFNSFAAISYIYIKDTYFMITGDKEIKGNFEPRNRNGI